MVKKKAKAKTKTAKVKSAKAKSTKAKAAKPKRSRKPSKKTAAPKKKKTATVEAEIPASGIPVKNEYTSISQLDFIEQYLGGNVPITTLNRWMNRGLVAVDYRERKLRIYLDHPITEKFLKSREEDNSEKAALLTQKIIELTIGDIESLPRSLIDRVKSIIDIQKVKIKNDAMLGVLISRKVVKQCYDQFIAIDNAILKTLGTSLSNEIGAIFECTDNEKILKTQRLLDNEILKAIETKRDKYIRWIKRLDKNA